MGQFTGTATTGTFVNTDIAAGAGLDASKLKHQSVYWTDFNFDDSDTPTAKNSTMLIMDGVGEIISAKAWCVDSGTTTDIDFDLHVNGSSVLSAQINVVHGTGDNVAVSGTIASGSLIAADIVEAQIALVTSSTGATGARMQIVVNHNYYAG